MVELNIEVMKPNLDYKKFNSICWTASCFPGVLKKQEE